MFTFPINHFSGAAAPSVTYVNSVQQVSITIPANTTSATATISSVGSLAFIVYGGESTSATATMARGYARVELTNSTIVTAYRNGALTDTVTVNLCVVDATSSLVNSVQSGTVTIGVSNTSSTATISSVNSNYTVLTWLGQTTGDSFSYGANDVYLSYSGTTLTATRITSNSATPIVGYQVIEFNSAALNSIVQDVKNAWTNTSSSSTQTITSVNVNNTILFYAGSGGNNSSNAATVKQRATLTNGTTITYNTNTAGSISCQYNLFVVEFASGVLNSSVQRGTITLSGATSRTATISSVTTTKTLMNSLQFTSTQTSSNLPNVLTRVSLTNSTTVTANKNTSTNATTLSYEVAEFT